MTRLRPEHKRRLALFGTDVRLLVSGPQNVAAEAEVALTRVQAQLEIVHRTLTSGELVLVDGIRAASPPLTVQRRSA